MSEVFTFKTEAQRFFILLDPNQSGQVGDLASLLAAQVTIPAGTFSQPVTVEIRFMDEDASLKSAREKDEKEKRLTSVGTRVDITARETATQRVVRRLNQPVEVSFAYDPAAAGDSSALGIFYWDEVRLEWRAVPTPRVDAARRTIQVSVDHFTLFAVFSAPPEDVSGFSFRDVFAYPN
ncbi:MAG: hypothetical protein HY548_10270, partial [Elusimicrobia bacterium]|nr:hypothetical protein [Elusimicrobiota bacterium]